MCEYSYILTYLAWFNQKILIRDAYFVWFRSTSFQRWIFSTHWVDGATSGASSSNAPRLFCHFFAASVRENQRMFFAEMGYLGEKHHSKPIISSYPQFIKGQSLNTFSFQNSISLTYYQVLPLSLKDCADNGTAVCSQACPNIAKCIVQITKEQTTLGWSPYNIRINTCKIVNILYIQNIRSSFPQFEHRHLRHVEMQKNTWTCIIVQQNQ